MWSVDLENVGFSWSVDSSSAISENRWLIKNIVFKNGENEITIDLTWKIEIERKTRQNAENKQTFGLTGKIEIGKWKISSKYLK